MSNPLVRYDNEYDAAGNPLYLNRYGQVCTEDGRTRGWQVSREKSVSLWANAFAEDLADLVKEFETQVRK